ncbi:FtsK/SpoIIIE domain-containing protein [Streptomyces sp. NPDC005648]|uniref:FtsK/SpoIIIE domain-containing protein n=1 Tax=Streptomyces sp. NPDC005648 TaxID=3157044 RepID=UPI0033B6D0A2
MAESRSICAWLVAQAALLHSPAEVTFHIFSDGPLDDVWRFLRWLPAVGIDQKIGPVMELLEARAAQRTRDKESRAKKQPAVVVVFDGVRGLRASSPMTQILREGPGLGIYSICLESELRLLPAECPAAIEWRPESRTGALLVGKAITGGRPRPPSSEIMRREIDSLDLVTPAWLDETARTLAPLRDATVQNDAPLASCRLLDLLSLPDPDGMEIASQWSEYGRGTIAPVGMAHDGPLALDLVGQGPHALVCGASGSGKTEFLRTWIASLAVSNRPDEMNFVLIDYKGGSELGVLAGLPHTAASATDLDSRLGERVLTALAAELRRRERQLIKTSTKDIEDYAGLRRRSPHLALPPLPRLVVVVNELTLLSEEMPDFVEGLVELGARARSLGIHLILGTQQPAGRNRRVIQANTNLRIALRTASAEDSEMAIGARDAARIPKTAPGRAYVRTGVSELTQVQFARVLDRVERAVDGRPSVHVRELTLGPDPGPTYAPGSVTKDLDVLVGALQHAATVLGVPAPAPPWLPPLGDVVHLTDLEPPAQGRDLAPLAFGLEDVPEEQAQRPALLDLAEDANLRIVGRPRSGRSQALRTLAAAVAGQCSSADVHLYGIDCGNGALQALDELPHCGAVVGAGRPELVVRLLGRLTATMRRRQELLHQGQFANLVAQRQAVAGPRRLPYLLVLLDEWDGFVSRMEAAGHPQAVLDLFALLREGPQVGIRTVLTGDKGSLTRSTAVSSLGGEALVLSLGDREDYAAFGVRARHVPIQQVAGRALRSGSGRELQIAVLPGPLTRGAQTDALAVIAARAEERDRAVQPSRRPFRIEDFPLVADQFHVGDAHGHPVGREEVLAWLRDRFATGTSVALLGQRRVGKSWVLEELRGRLRDQGASAVRHVVLPPEGTDSPDVLAGLLDADVGGDVGAAQRLVEKVRGRTGQRRVAFLLDEIGRMVRYDAQVVSWLRDLGQAGAWLVYTGTEKDWNRVVRWALTVPGSSFGNDVNARVLGPLEIGDALTFLTGTAANLGVDIAPDRTGAAIIDLVGTWPFYLQAAGDAVVRAVLGNSLRPLTDPDALRELLDRKLLDEWTHHFLARWTEIGPAGRAALLVQPGRVPADAALAQRQDLREVGLLRHGDEWLDDRPFFGWVARNENSLRDEEPRT